MVWREVFGVVFFFGFVILVWDLLTIGKKETRKAEPKLIGILRDA
jgi:nitric oxide reductase subunit B